MKTRSKSIVTAIVLTLLLSSFNFAQNPPRPDKPMGPNFQMKYNMQDRIDKLNLTDAQRDQFQKMRLNFQKQMIDLKANLQKSELELKEIQSSDNISRSAVLDAVKNISENKAVIAMAMANHKMDMYDVLTPDQRKIWEGMKNHHVYGKKMMQYKMKNKFKQNIKKKIAN